MEPDRPIPSADDAPTGGKKRGQCGRGFWVLLTIVLLLFAAVAIPNSLRARTRPSQSACINNLRQIDGAKQQWALENKKEGSAMPSFSDIGPYLGRGATSAEMMTCPQGSATNDFFSSY